MSLRPLLLLSLLACPAIGCEPPSATGAVSSALQIDCGDRGECTVSNGPGVYAEVDQWPAIHDNGFVLMITGFVNHGTSVGFHGYYHDATTSRFSPYSGSVYAADYGVLGQLLVKSVDENGTFPTWMLTNPAQPNAPDITVKGADLSQLRLYIQMSTPSAGLPTLHTYALQFGDQSTLGVPKHTSIYRYWMGWRRASEPNAALDYSYCKTADPGKFDALVFQKGMIVSPFTGAVTRDATTANEVVFSCSFGAIATSSIMGYYYTDPYNGWYFDAFIKMKGARYCPDGLSHTKPGVDIYIDSPTVAGIAHDHALITADNLEAYWTPTGPKCLGPKRRVPALGFVNCATPLPACGDMNALDLDSPHLKSGLQP